MTDNAKKFYTITDQAGEWVAGIRVRQGKVVIKTELELTDAQAEHPLRVGEIVEKSPAKAKPAADAAKPAAKVKEK